MRKWSTMKKLIWLRGSPLGVTPEYTTVGPTSLATFTAVRSAPLQSLVVTMEPQQDLHGYDNPWPAGGGKNKLNPSAVMWKKWYLNNNKLGVLTDDSPIVEFSVSGEEITVTTSGNHRGIGFSVEAADYDRTVSVNGDVPNSIYLFDSYTVNAVITRTGANNALTIPANTSGFVAFRWTDGGTYVIKAQLELGSSATTYSPSSNICPISGYTEVNLWRTGRNLFPVDIDIDDSLYTHSYSLSSYPAIADFFAALNILRGQKVIASCAKTGTASGSSIGQVRVMYGSTTLVAFNPNEAKVVPDVDYSTATSVIIYGSTTGATVTDVMLEAGETVHDFVPFTGTSVTIDLDGTRYGGTLDVLTGVLTVDRVKWLLGSKSWTKISGKTSVYVTPWTDEPVPIGVRDVADILCSCYVADTASNVYAESTPCSIAQGRQGLYLGYWIINDATHTAQELPTFLADKELVYELATPIQFHVDPSTISTLKNENYIWSDAGQVTVEYRSN